MEDEPRISNLVVRFPRAEIDRIAEIGRERGYTMAEAVRYALRRLIKGSIRLPVKGSDHEVELPESERVGAAA